MLLAVVCQMHKLDIWGDGLLMRSKHTLEFESMTLVQSRLAITRSSGGMFSNRVISEARYRISLCSQVLYIKATSLSSISL